VILVPRTPEEIRALFDRWASTYDIDLVNSTADGMGPLSGYHESLHEAASLVPVAEGQSVLDVGIGTGAFAALLAERGVKIYGIDPSGNMLASCQERHPEFTVRAGTFTHIPFEESSFDAAISSFAFHEVLPEHRKGACAELARVVKHGGWICLLDIMFVSQGSRDAARRAIGSYWDDEEDYPFVAELDQVLRDAGFAHTCWRQTAHCHWVVIARRST
jgi:putative AdoMet-dependent methyltransferase